ncbi:MAG: DegT/DnrJ/EryC1/StrS family aminotransferase [Spirochaetaceae bacterium]|nr:MAG: DegT/DnrJ/EryC1/StrS family aminotransferase [Spirochaetaceae bacterium]
MEKLALFGGSKTKTTPFGVGKRFGEEEKQEVLEVLDSDILFYVFGTKVREMEAKMRGMYGMKHCNGCSSGTAAVHIALGSLQLPPGKEVITSAITDMGTLTGILYQCLIPRFADIDPETYNMDPAEVRKLVNSKTGAIVAVHHAGLPAEIEELKSIAAEHGLPLVEDCAQAWYTHYKGQLCGTFADISAFSLNHFKLITSGSGGMVLTNRDDLEEVVKLFIDKCYFRDGRKRNPYFLAPNYQMTELQGAVAKVQLDRIAVIVRERNELGMRLIRGLESIPGVIPQHVPEGREHSFFLLVVRVDPRVIQATVAQFCEALDAEGIPCEPNKITGGMATYLYDIFRNRSAFPGSAFPFVSRDLGSDISYPKGLCARAELAFEQTFNFNISEFYSTDDIDDMILATEKVAHYYRVKNV